MMHLSFAQQSLRDLSAAQKAYNTKVFKCSKSCFRCLDVNNGRVQRAAANKASNNEGYLGSDGRRKASLEDAARNFKHSSSASDSSDSEDESTWSFGWQLAERNLTWNDDLKSRLIQRIAASELKCTPEALEGRLEALQGVLPTLSQRVHTMKPEVIAQLCARPDTIAERLIRLKSIFPLANVELMALRNTDLLLKKSAESIAVAADELRSFLPQEVDVDRLCEQHPSSLEVPSFKAAVNEVKRLMPTLNLATALNTNPEIIFSTQRHNDIIPYDPVPGQS